MIDQPKDLDVYDRAAEAETQIANTLAPEGRSAQQTPPQAIWRVVKRLSNYARLGWMLAREPGIPRRHKALLYAAGVYSLTPIHTPVSFIPVIGLIDTPYLMLIGVRHALAYCPHKEAIRYLRELALDPEQIDWDLAAIRSAAKGIVGKTRTGIGTGVRFTGGIASGLTRRVLRRNTKPDQELSAPSDADNPAT